MIDSSREFNNNSHDSCDSSPTAPRLHLTSDRLLSLALHPSITVPNFDNKKPITCTCVISPKIFIAPRPLPLLPHN